MRLILCFLFFIYSTTASAQVLYPYPVYSFHLRIENKSIQMAYMDVAGAASDSKVILLLHGKNFNGYYWHDVIPALVKKGFRVIVPDQVGWGKSDKANIHYSFHLLAANTKKLLDSLGIKKVHIIGHSMGGMLAKRFALMFPESVEKLVLENPIGLEDYKAFIPYRSVDDLFESEKAATYESHKKYQQSYYPVWRESYEQYVKAQAEALLEPNFEATAFVNALTYQMIYEQPVLYEFKNLQVPALLIIGQEDRTVVGKNLLDPGEQKKYGNYPLLGRALQKEIKHARLVELAGVGHIPHVQAPTDFIKAVLSYLDGE